MCMQRVCGMHAGLVELCNLAIKHPFDSYVSVYIADFLGLFTWSEI